jgi:protein-S-isoprenylcysteine O-methyltransferase Ste14
MSVYSHFSPMALLIALGAFVVLAFVWPMVRLRRKTGQWGLVSHRGADPCQRLVGLLTAGWIAAVGAWAAALALVPPEALGVGAPWPRFGWTLMAGGLLVVVAAQAQMGLSWRIGIDDRPTALVTHGIFSLVRNPIFSGMLLALAGVAALSPSAWTLVGWVAVAQLVAVQVRLEEQHLLRLHGDEYARYLARVGRFWPSASLRRAA